MQSRVVLPMLAMALSPWAVKKRQRAHRREGDKKKRKSVTFALVWDEKYEAVLFQRCQDHMRKHYHGELCGRCEAIFTINIK